ncbi:MAG: hypothetical protein ACHP7D_11565 [Lysobacterales bacterium]
MNKFMQGAVLALGLVTLGVAQARSDVRDGNAMIQPVKGDKYSIDGATMGKAELYGYIGDLRDREHLTGLVLKRGGDDEQRHVIGSIARTLQLKAFEQDGGDLKPIDLPAAAPTPPPPPIDGKPQTAAAPPATDPATPAH